MEREILETLAGLQSPGKRTDFDAPITDTVHQGDLNPYLGYLLPNLRAFHTSTISSRSRISQMMR